MGPARPAATPATRRFVALPGELDFDGEPRLFGPAVDHGADEDQP